MEKELLRKAIVERFPPQHVNAVHNRVISGGHKIFAILILLKQPRYITAFIRKASYRSQGIDSLLPINEDVLRTLFEDKQLAIDFTQRQRSFTAPLFFDNVFTLMIPAEAILPFIHEQYLNSGGFGEVYGVTIEPSHQKFEDASLCQRGVSAEDKGKR